MSRLGKELKKLVRTPPDGIKFIPNEEERMDEIHAEIAVQEGESHTAEFLLTRGPYAFIGYGWIGCTQGNEARPFPMEWGREYGTPVAPCSETVPGKSGVFAREWTEANVEWDCNGAVGTIKMK